jgi:hypothetical protein
MQFGCTIGSLPFPDKVNWSLDPDFVYPGSITNSSGCFNSTDTNSSSSGSSSESSRDRSRDRSRDGLGRLVHVLRCLERSSPFDSLPQNCLFSSTGGNLVGDGEVRMNGME